MARGPPWISTYELFHPSHRPKEGHVVGMGLFCGGGSPPGPHFQRHFVPGYGLQKILPQGPLRTRDRVTFSSIRPCV